MKPEAPRKQGPRHSATSAGPKTSEEIIHGWSRQREVTRGVRANTLWQETHDKATQLNLHATIFMDAWDESEGRARHTEGDPEHWGDGWEPQKPDT